MSHIQKRPAVMGPGVREPKTKNTSIRSPHYSGQWPIQKLLPRLENVRQCGSETKWRSNCPNPVHTKGKDMLSVEETSDGTVLIRCHGCMDTAAVMQALNLTMADLFPTLRTKSLSPTEQHLVDQTTRQYGWSAALRILDYETIVLLAAAHDLAKHKPLNATDHDRLKLAAQRIHDARRVLA